jgi:hypothetical protein
LAEALAQLTARLPRVEVRTVVPALGRNTNACDPIRNRARSARRGTRARARHRDRERTRRAAIVVTGGSRALLVDPPCSRGRPDRGRRAPRAPRARMCVARRAGRGAHAAPRDVVSSASDVRARELTPRGPGGVAVVRVCGRGALARVQELVHDRHSRSGACASSASRSLSRPRRSAGVVRGRGASRAPLARQSTARAPQSSRHFGATMNAIRASKAARPSCSRTPRATAARASCSIRPKARCAASSKPGCVSMNASCGNAGWVRARSELARYAIEPARVVLAGRSTRASRPCSTCCSAASAWSSAGRPARRAMRSSSACSWARGRST